jgi:hypothetical protein
MIGILLCLIALISTLLISRRSLPGGLSALLAWGFGYGIIRANVPQAASHFIFDAGVLGLYIGQFKAIFARSDPRLQTLRVWVGALALWPCVVAFMPLQTPLVSLVGLRSSIFFLPMILIGGALDGPTLKRVAQALAILNLVALVFAGGEYFLGVPTFYPLNETTELIYASNDVAGYQYLRIPGTFVTAHVFGGTMVMTLPLLFGCWTQQEFGKWKRLLMLGGMMAALLGVLLSSTRLNFVIGAAAGITMVVAGKFSTRNRLIILGALMALGIAASMNERFGRFKSLTDGDAVTERIHGSVNRGFWEILYEYPMGNGLGGGGTSMPYFLADQVRQPMIMESEYSRILLETGIVGLATWIAFIAWFIAGSQAFAPGNWRSGRLVAWVCCLGYFGVGMIGIGMMTAVPQTVLMLISVGWVTTVQAPDLSAALAGKRTRFATLVSTRIRVTA